MKDENLLIADAKIYINVASLLSSTSDDQIDDVSNVLNSLGSAMGIGNPHRFANLGNILGLLLIYPSPSSISVANVSKLAQGIVKYCTSAQDTDVSEGLHEDLEEFANWISDRSLTNDNDVLTLEDNLIVQSATDLSRDTEIQSERYGYATDGTQLAKEILFLFVKAKTLFLSKYSADIRLMDPLFDIVQGYKPFEEWYSGNIVPFTYYWDNYGSLSNKASLDLYYFLLSRSSNEKIGLLTEPLSLPAYSEKLSINNWISRVILPVVVYHDCDFQPLLEWLYIIKSWDEQEPSQKYKVWNNSIRSIISFKDHNNNVLEFSKYANIIRYFLGSCYYYSLYFESADNVSSIQMLKIYDLIKETLDIIGARLDITHQNEVLITKIDFDTLKEIPDFDAFVNDRSNPFAELIEVNDYSINFLSDIISVCEKLYPTNKCTIIDFLKLKYSINSDIASSEREVAKIMTNLNSNNWKLILSSAQLFTNSFISNNKSDENIGKLIIDRFLFHNLFDVVEEFYEKGEIQVLVDTLYSLVLKKFWESFNKASNFNSKIGKLNEAAMCMVLFDKITLNDQLSPENKKEIVRIKHLFKATTNIKNFKIIIKKGIPFSPSQMINQFGTVYQFDSRDDEDERRSPMALISTILEQNPKSYLAFEKLYKILNDLLIFFDESLSQPTVYFNKLKSMCIESSLIDNNFEFAYRQSSELLEHYASDKNQNVNDFWLTFYQVGNYVSPDWFTESSSIYNDKIEILIKQREILSKTLKFTKPSDASIDNSRLILKQWEKINEQIEDWYLNLQLDSNINDSDVAHEAIPDHMTNLANDIINDASNTTGQTSEKLSNLFVSGLGWAIGANPQ